mgnify:FL=1
MGRFIILQTVSPSYRNKFFDYLSSMLKDDFDLYSGNYYFEKSVTSDLSYSKRKKVTNLFFLNRMFLFQFGMWSIVFRKNTLVLEMNPRIISNWIILVIRKILNRKTVLWGHAWPRSGKYSYSDKIRHVMRLLGNIIIVYTKTQQNELKERMSSKKIYFASNSLYCVDEMKTNYSNSSINNMIYVGRLTESKKPLLFIKGFHKIYDKLPKNIKLFMVGDGPEKKKISQYIKQNNLLSSVEVFGHEDDYETLKKLYSSSLFSVSPGYIGLSVTQSFGFGVPMIVSEHENHSPEIEAVKEGENAIYFQTDNVDSLCEKMYQMYEYRDKWINKRNNIVKDCQTNYSIEAMSLPFIEIYNQN